MNAVLESGALMDDETEMEVSTLAFQFSGQPLEELERILEAEELSDAERAAIHYVLRTDRSAQSVAIALQREEDLQRELEELRDDRGPDTHVLQAARNMGDLPERQLRAIGNAAANIALKQRHGMAQHFS